MDSWKDEPGWSRMLPAAPCASEEGCELSVCPGLLLEGICKAPVVKVLFPSSRTSSRCASSHRVCIFPCCQSECSTMPASSSTFVFTSPDNRTSRIALFAFAVAAANVPPRTMIFASNESKSTPTVQLRSGGERGPAQSQVSRRTPRPAGHESCDGLTLPGARRKEFRGSSATSRSWIACP